jgi:hypothetical protein
MIEAMSLVVPDVQIDVQYPVSDMWAKSAEVVVDELGRLAVWKTPLVQGGNQGVAEAVMAMSA